mmetsp:Transcript_10292/g.43792  ORF Transcript_10292/g.43792 Transcript_10292/m.43792 type:complete len:564 (-) Transcript_10292:55-1746(-)
MSQRQVQINTELARSALASDVLAIVRRSVAEFNVVNCGTALSRIARAPDGRRLVAREGGDPDVASLLATAAGLVRHHARHVESRQLASLLHACGKLGVGVEAAAELVSAVERATEMHASKFNPQELANAVWGCAKLGVRVDRALVRLLGDAAAASLRRGGAGSGSGSRDEKKKFDWRVDWTAQGVSNVAWAFATLGASAREPGAFAQLFHALFSAIERKASAGAFNAQETANALWAVARLAASADDAVHQSIGPDNSDSDSEGSALRSARAAASALASSTTGSWFERQRKEGGLESQHVANIAWACGKLGLASDARVAEANATAAAAAALSERVGLAAGPVDRARLLADFRAMFSRTPWDPSPDPVEVGAWRGALWARALALQVPPSEGEQAAAAVAAAGEAAQTAFDGHRLAHLVFAPGAREAVAHARARGLALVMITNGHHRVQRDKLAAVRAHELFPDPNSIIVGGEEVLRGGEEKPSRSIFLKGCGVAGCAPHEAAHVGDSLATDVQRGVGAALRASVWVNPAGTSAPPDAAQPTHVIRSIAGLSDVIDALLGEDAAET